MPKPFEPTRLVWVLLTCFIALLAPLLPAIAIAYLFLGGICVVVAGIGLEVFRTTDAFGKAPDAADAPDIWHGSATSQASLALGESTQKLFCWVNIDGTVMANDFIDIEGKAYGVAGSHLENGMNTLHVDDHHG